MEPAGSAKKLIEDFANMHVALGHPSSQRKTELPDDGLPRLILCQTNRDDGVPENYLRLRELSTSFCDNQRKIQSIPRVLARLLTGRDGEKPNRIFLALSKAVQSSSILSQELSNRKAVLYHWSLDKLKSERRLVDLLEEYLQTSNECSKFKQKNYSLETTEALAFFLRFKEILDILFSGQKNAKGLTSVYPAAKRLLEASRRFVSKEESVELQRLEVRLLVTQIAIGQLLIDMETSLGLGDTIVSVLRCVTPLFAYLSCICEDRFSYVEYIPGHFVSSQAQNIEWAKALQEVFKQIQRGYFEQQITLYEEASRGLSTCLENEPKYKKKPYNFYHYVDKVTPIQPPGEYRSEIEAFLNRFYGSTPSQVEQQKSFTQAEIDAFLLAECGEVKTNAKDKKTDNQNKPSNAPQGVKSAAVPSSSKKQTPAAAEKKTVESSVSPILQSLLKATGLCHQKRVSRWLKLDPRKLDEVFKFVDYKNGVAVYQYAGMTHELLQEQFLMHAFSPNIDKLITVKELRDKYCLQTESGYSIFVEVVRQGKPKLRGIACYAQNKSGHVYHRKIEIRSRNLLHRHLHSLQKHAV